jgi:hypothetical protein
VHACADWPSFICGEGSGALITSISPTVVTQTAWMSVSAKSTERTEKREAIDACMQI